MALTMLWFEKDGAQKWHEELFLEVTFFWVFVGQFGEDSFVPPKICLLLHLCFSRRLHESFSSVLSKMYAWHRLLTLRTIFCSEWLHYVSVSCKGVQRRGEGSNGPGHQQQGVKLQKLHLPKMLQLDASSYCTVTKTCRMDLLGTCLREACKCMSSDPRGRRSTAIVFFKGLTPYLSSRLCRKANSC